MKNNLFLVMALLSLSIVTAQDFIVDNIGYNIISGTTNVEVTKKTECYSGSVIIPSTVNYNSTDYAVTTIGEAAFNMCTDLTGVNIPNSVTSINKIAFAGCNGLTAVDLPDSLITIGIGAFSRCQNLNSISIPDSVVSIELGAFMFCNNLSSVSMGNTVNSIGNIAFRGCTSLTSLDIPDSVTSIGENSFAQCTSLSTIVIGKSVNQIGNLAFFGCTGLTSVTVKQETPLIINSTIFLFLDLSSVTLYVPFGSESAYEATRFWQDFNPITSVSNPLSKTLSKTLSEDDIVVYPVPANSTLNISQKTSAKLEQATLLNFKGEIVGESKSNTVNISKLNQGLYTLKIDTDQGVITKKVVKN